MEPPIYIKDIFLIMTYSDYSSKKNFYWRMISGELGQKIMIIIMGKSHWYNIYKWMKHYTPESGHSLLANLTNNHTQYE